MGAFPSLWVCPRKRERRKRDSLQELAVLSLSQICSGISHKRVHRAALPNYLHLCIQVECAHVSKTVLTLFRRKYTVPFGYMFSYDDQQYLGSLHKTINGDCLSLCSKFLFPLCHGDTTSLRILLISCPYFAGVRIPYSLGSVNCESRKSTQDSMKQVSGGSSAFAATFLPISRLVRLFAMCLRAGLYTFPRLIVQGPGPVRRPIESGRGR